MLSPLTFGLFTKHSHLSMLDSFVEDPELHRSSVRVPDLRGGPFIDYDGDAADIRRFRDETRQRCAVQLRYADAINALYELLQTQARGQGLGALYGQIDESIRHMLEISYDVSKQPGARFIERLFYESPAYDTSLQTCLLEPVSMQARPFALSTPQIRRTPGSVQIAVPFQDPLWDHLCAGVGSGTDLVEMLRPHVVDGSSDDVAALRALLTDQPRPEHSAPPAEEVRVRYFGHACVLIEGYGTSILIDPLLSYPGECSIDHYTFDDLPPQIDYVLITHPHQDHIVMESLLRIRHRVRHVVVGRSGGGALQDISLKMFFTRLGFPSVVELADFDEISLPHGRIVGAPFFGEHADLDVRSKVVHAVELGGKVFIMFADSNPPCVEQYEWLRRMFPKVHCLFLGMECVGAPATWLYGALLQKMLTRGEDQSRRLDGCDLDKALQLRAYFEPEMLYIYAMGAEPWISHITSIVYSEDLPQFQAARGLEAAARDGGFHAELLYGKKELHL
ncbi:hypothetical protein ABIC90_005407 [Variovorax boronicumulans]